MPDKPTPLASYAAGQMAIQTLLSVLVNLYIGQFDDPEKARKLVSEQAEGLLDRVAVPDLPAAELKSAREQAKLLVNALISGASRQ